MPSTLQRTYPLPVAICLAAAALSSGAFAQSPASHDVLDLDEAAAFLRVRPGVILALAEAHRIPGRRVGDDWRFSQPALLDWLKGDGPKEDGLASKAQRVRRAPPVDSETGSRRTPFCSCPSEVDAEAQPEATALTPQELAQTTGRGPAAASPRPRAESQSPPPASPPPPSPPPAVGERPVTPSTQDIALRDARVLLGRGDAAIDFGTSYTHNTQGLYPVVRAESKAAALNATLRYGLANDLQLTLRAPVTWRTTSTFADATVAGTKSPTVTRTPGGVAREASVSLLGVATREAVGRPTVVWSLDSVLPLGGGDRGVGGGIVLSRSFDPAVLFAGVNYLYGLHIDPADSRWSLAKQNLAVQVGYTYAVNDTLALSTEFVGTWRNTRSPDGIAIPPPGENYALQLGTTWLLARGFFMEPAVAMGLGGDSPGLTLSLNFSHSLPRRNKH